MLLRSLHARLAAMLTIGLAVLSLFAATAAFYFLREEMGRMSDSALQETAQRLVPLAVMDILDRYQQSGAERIAGVRAHGELLTYIVRDQTGKTILQSHDANPAVFPPALKPGFASTATHRLYTEAVLQGTVSLTIAEPLAARNRADMEAALVVVRPLLLLIPLGLIGAWLIVRSGLRPIRRCFGRSSMPETGRLCHRSGRCSPTRQFGKRPRLSPRASE